MASVGFSNGVLVITSLMVVVTLMLLTVFARLYRKAGPHEALVVYGFRGTRIVKGRGTIIFPMIENWHELSLELMSFDVAPQQDLYTRQGVAVTVEAVAQIKVKSDPESILTAAEQFLTKSDEEREGLIRLVMEGHLRGIIGQLTVEEIVKQPEMVGDRMRATCADDMNKMGLEVISFTIKEVRDKNEYITKAAEAGILDMENQLLQVKTQVAIAIADEHVLERKRKEYEERVAEWTRRAELAVDKKQDDLARAALERSLSYRRMAASCEQQVEDQAAQVEHLKTALRQLEQKLAEARALSDVLIAQHRRARALRKTSAARAQIGSRSNAAAFRRMQDKVVLSEAVGAAAADLVNDSIDDRLAALEEQEQVERLLAEIKVRRRAE